MEVRNQLKELCRVTCVAALLALAGCAQNQVASKTEAPASSQAAKEEPKSEKTVVASMAPGEEIVPDYAVVNPVPIPFDKLSVKLRETDKQILTQIKDRAKKARKVTITGYCDRKQVGNAKAAALARAQSVKQELGRLGVNTKLVKIKYVTDVADKHLVEVEL